MFTLNKARDEIDRGHLSSVEVVENCLRRAEEQDESLNAFVTRTPELALEAAREADRKRIRGEDPGRLAGLPVAIKDNLVTRGVRTTCAAGVLADYMPPYNATAVDRLLGAGAALAGKTNLDAFGMGSTSENSWFGAVRNPVDPGRVAGGSSGGSAAAVASGMALAALGTDTGGSVRQPAALCGICGIKPTYGRVSRYGLVAYASSLDQVGPMAHDVTDCALLLNVICGHDPQDSTTAQMNVPDHLVGLEEGVAGMVLGVPSEYFGGGLDPEVEKLVRGAIDALKDQGARIEEVSLPHTDYAVAAYYIVACAQASSNLARYDGVRFGSRRGGDDGLGDLYFRTRGEGFGWEVKKRIMLGTYALSSGYYDAYYLKAMKARTLIRRDFDTAFEKVDALLGPTYPTPAPQLGEGLKDPLSVYLADVYTIPASLAGLPALSVPCGQTREGLPVGLQIIGKPFYEPTILRVGRTLERDQSNS
jgi:aspartyl-tRNA(Asn)/glutamyl-tRNA(Gln) amidotransferase subunit A